MNFSKENEVLTLSNCGPIAIGGVGGSGTRLVADIVSQCGFYLGNSLNGTHDNLWFTFLFKRPYWFENFPFNDEIVKALRLFERATLTGLSAPNRAEDFDLVNTIVHRSENHPDLSPDMLLVLADQLRNSHGTDLANYAGWGWKEPNTHIFLPQIASTFKEARYIHVIRNGLDMAFSKNQQQLRNWGRFMCAPTDCKAPLPSLSLDFWITANRRALDIGTSQLHDRFLLLNYDHLCASPEKEIFRLIEFLGVTLNFKGLETLKNFITPRSIGRHKGFTTSIFTRSQMDAVREFGFETVGPDTNLR